jgi:hypothetical protein
MPVRTICIAVAEVLEGGTKSGFYSELRSSLDMARQVANLAVTACVRLDDLSLEKMPASKEKGMSVVNQAYHASKVVLPPGSQSLASGICGAVVCGYMSDRWQLRRGIRSVRLYRSMPWPLSRGNNHLQIVDAGEFLTARIRLASKWWTVRLAGNLSQIAQVLDVSQDAILGGHLQANSECSLDVGADECSHNAESGEDIDSSKSTALAVQMKLFGD